MNGEWTILLWILVGMVFLAKIKAVRDLVVSIRKMSAVGIICLVLSLGYFANVSYTKDGLNLTPTVLRTALPLGDTSSSVMKLSVPASVMPAWWQGEDSDGDGDGIPDLWEKWTHGNRQVSDGAIDRDEDGLTDLEEFQNQTDPRTADTDGDGFSDAFEVANGMDPVVKADFTPTEPDANHNGRIDLWEEAPYLYGFTDTDHNGFDDIYELYYLEPASDRNFDVVITVYTTRSAVLTWNGGLDGIVLMPTTGQDVRLRLSFDADTEVKLMAAPAGTDSPEAGGLWKAKFEASFSPRSSQSAVGSIIVASNDDVTQNVVVSESIITRFPDNEVSMRVMTLSEGFEDKWTKLVFTQRRFAIVPELAYFHSVGDTVGPFSITNTVNVDAADIEWRATHGAMSPALGPSSSITVTRLPGYNEAIIVLAEVELDENSRALKTAEVRLCPRKAFSVDLYAGTFSPELGSNVVFAVNLPGCLHQNDAGWLEAEVMSETTNGWGHTAWVDMDSTTEPVDRYADTTRLPSSLIFTWDGAVEDSAPLASSVATVTPGKSASHRTIPAVTVKAEASVSPPSYMLFVRMYNTDKTTILHQESRQIFAL